MARVCEGCDKAMVDGVYYDVMVAEKDPTKPHDQDVESAYGDFCRECTENGKAGEILLDFLEEERKKADDAR